MIVTIHQPEHLPWLGLFNKIAKCEKFVILDSVQFEKNYFQNRNKILGSNGVQWIGIPVSNKEHMDGSIASTEIATDPKNLKWKDKYLLTIKQSYCKHPFFNEVYPVLKSSLNTESKFIADINIAIIKAFCNELDIHPVYIRSSELNISGTKSDLILNICKETNANLYIAGPSGRDYLNMQSFKHTNIDVKFNDYQHPIYPQKKTDDFISHLSALDLFMNVGFKEAKRVIMNNNESLSNL